MKIRAYNLVYFFKLALKGMVKNGVMTLASILILMSCLLVMGSAWAVSENVSLNLSNLTGYNQIVVFVEEGADPAAVSQVGEQIKAMKGISKVEFTSKDQALDKLIAQYKDHQDIFSVYQGENNPLKDQYTLTYDGTVSVSTLRYRLEQLDHVALINSHEDTAANIDSLKNIVSLVFTWLMVLLFVVSLFVIGNTIKLAVFSRRDEVAIMRYVGATGFFVSVPFYIEAVLIGLLAGGLGYGVQYYLYKYFMVELLGDYQIVSVIPFVRLAYPLLAMFLLVGVVAGLISCANSLRKYNKV